ncbi:hypothetical protein [Granulicella tundricola]|nr:hypothetical protein [Granulicella tundricola]
MKKLVLIVVMAISFFLLFPVSWRIGQRFFTRPFNKKFYDPILLVCRDHVEFRLWHELGGSEPASALGEGCTLQVTPERQRWVEEVVPQMKSPGDSSWTVRVKQLGENRQWIDLELLGDGIAGMIYEVRGNEITPLNSRLTGPEGQLYVLVVNLLLWVAIWIVVWGIRPWVVRVSIHK